MRTSRWWIAIVTGCLVLGIATQALALPDFARETEVACVACHVNVAGGPELTDAGTAYKADKTAPEGPTEGAMYVGNKKCRMCHINVHKAWEETPHAKALEMLSTDEEANQAMAKKLGVELKGAASEDPACLPCHVTGYQLAGGFPGDEKTKPLLSGVTCESCHGPGSVHVKAKKAEKLGAINANVSERMCVACHTSGMSPNFDFAEYSKKVHAVPAAE